MKTFLTILVLALLGGGLWWWAQNKAVNSPAPITEEAVEYCYALIQKSPDSSFPDKYTLRLTLQDEEASGALRMLPAEKDALVGLVDGTVSALDPATNTRTAHLFWDTEGEGMTARQELNIIFSVTSAKIGLGEMTAREDGAYVYKDPTAVDYSLEIPAADCAELNEREAVEEYLWGNIARLSPIAPVLGGNWYVVAADIDLAGNSGTVTYEDGHIQEKRNFTYILSPGGAVESLTIE